MSEKPNNRITNHHEREHTKLKLFANALGANAGAEYESSGGPGGNWGRFLLGMLVIVVFGAIVFWWITRVMEASGQ